jgi:hypothetical protein
LNPLVVGWTSQKLVISGSLTGAHSYARLKIPTHHSSRLSKGHRKLWESAARFHVIL